MFLFHAEEGTPIHENDKCWVILNRLNQGLDITWMAVTKDTLRNKQNIKYYSDEKRAIREFKLLKK